MKIIRSLVKSFGIFFFTIFLSTSIFIMSLVQFTEYKTLKPIFTDIASQQLLRTITPEELEKLHSALLFQCRSLDEVELPLDSQKVVVKCSEIEATPVENFGQLVAGKLFDDIYYKQYECEFIDCLRQGGTKNLLVISSQHANIFFKRIQFYTWTLTSIFGLIFLIGTETWPGRLKGLGTSLIFVGLPFFLLEYLVDFFVPEALTSQVIGIVDITNKIVNSMSTNFLIVLIAGVVLVVVGYVLSYKKRKK